VGVRDPDEDEPLNAAAIYPAIVETRDRVVRHPHDQAARMVEVERKLLASVSDQLVASGLGQPAQDAECCHSRDLSETRLDLLSTTGAVLLSKPSRIVEERRIAFPSETELHLAASCTESYTSLVYSYECYTDQV